jgi:hypothetical protein
MLGDREQAQVAFGHVVGLAFGGGAVPVDGAGDDDPATQVPQLRVDVDEGLSRGSRRDEREDGRRDDEQVDADGRRPGTAWVAGVDWP